MIICRACRFSASSPSSRDVSCLALSSIIVGVFRADMFERCQRLHLPCPKPQTSSGEIGSRRPHLCRKLGIGIVPVIDSTGDLIEVISDPAVFGSQLPECGKQLAVDRGNRDNGTDACALNGSVDKLRLTDAVGRKAGGKIGIRRCYLFCFYGNATVVGLRRTNGNIANTIESLTAEIFFLSLPLLQSQKRFLATSANKAFAINRPVRFSPLLRSGVDVLAKSR